MLKYFTDTNKVNEYYNRFRKYIEEYSKEVTPKYKFWEKQVNFRCPVCKKLYDEGFDDENRWNIDKDRMKEKSEAIWHIQRCFCLHLFAQIRLNGDIEHIKLLIKIVGKDFAKIILTQMAKKNMVIALKLKLIVEELNKK